MINIERKANNARKDNFTEGAVENIKIENVQVEIV